MIDKVIINRHFVRIKAIQNLYAFYINQQADYQHILEEIKAEFVPDIFANTPADPQQLAQEKDQAIALFVAWEAAGHIDSTKQASYSSTANIAARKAWDNYQHHLAQEIKILKEGWESSLDKIRSAYLLSIQLIIEWFTLAQQQAHKIQQVLPGNINYPIKLAHSLLLDKLKTNNTFLGLLQKHKISWDLYMDLVARWYNQFVKNAGNLTENKPYPNTLEDERQVMKILLQDIIFNQEDIQNFFADLDLSWSEHKSIVKRLLYQLLNKLEINTCLEEIKETLQIGNTSAPFYSKLIATFLEKDRVIDKLIEQHITNWSLERIVPLDRIIIKLALCEMQYFDDIPTNVAINEYIELAKKYSTTKSSQFVNGVLDTIAKMI